jgi:hypothetical protein
MKTKTPGFSQQLKLANKLLQWHGGQSSALYAVGSCMLSDSYKGRPYDPAAHRGHADTQDEHGAVWRAIRELRNLRKDANFPEAVTPQGETECNALAAKLEKLYLKP